MKSRHALLPDIEYTESTTKEQRKQMREANQPIKYQMPADEWSRRFPNEPYPDGTKRTVQRSAVRNRFNPRGNDAS